MLLVSAYDVIAEAQRTIVIVASIITVIGCFLIGFLAILNVKKSESKVSKNYFNGIAFFFILTGISKIIFFYHDFYASDDLDIILWKIANVIMLSGFTILLHTIETHVYKKTKHVVTIVLIICIILHVAMVDKTMANLFLYIATGLSFILPFLVYLIIAKNSPGVVRKRATTIVLGMVLVLIASATSLIVMTGLLDLTISLIIGHSIVLIGFIVLGYGFITMNR